MTENRPGRPGTVGVTGPSHGGDAFPGACATHPGAVAFRPMRTTRLRVSLRDVEPAVVRVLDVPAGALLPELHDLLQAALGWTDSHLHLFDAGEVRYGMPDTDALDDERDETGVALRALPGRFVYLYDFGDGWEHDVEVLGAGGDRPGVVNGEGACPPEDVGGPDGYTELLAVLADPSDPEHRHLREWAGS